jgi:hypothetical protein
MLSASNASSSSAMLKKYEKFLGDAISIKQKRFISDLSF